jgi:hypothetical protein
LKKIGAWLDSEEVSGPDQIAMSVHNLVKAVFSEVSAPDQIAMLVLDHVCVLISSTFF